jgi:hypothetical protein
VSAQEAAEPDGEDGVGADCGILVAGDDGSEDLVDLGAGSQPKGASGGGADGDARIVQGFLNDWNDRGADAVAESAEQLAGLASFVGIAIKGDQRVTGKQARTEYRSP